MKTLESIKGRKYILTLTNKRKMVRSRRFKAAITMQKMLTLGRFSTIERSTAMKTLPNKLKMTLTRLKYLISSLVKKVRGGSSAPSVANSLRRPKLLLTTCDMSTDPRRNVLIVKSWL